MNLSNSAIHMETAQFKVNGEWDIYATQARWKEVRIPSVSDIAYSKVCSDDVKMGKWVSVVLDNVCLTYWMSVNMRKFASVGLTGHQL